MPRSTALLLRQLTGPAVKFSPTLLRWPATDVAVAAVSLHNSSVWRCEKPQTAVGGIIVIIIGKKLEGFVVEHYFNFNTTLKIVFFFLFKCRSENGDYF